MSVRDECQVKPESGWGQVTAEEVMSGMTEVCSEHFGSSPKNSGDVRLDRIEYRLRRVHNDAGNLRNVAEVCKLTRVSAAEIDGDRLLQEAQKKDPDLRPVVKWLETGLSPLSAVDISITLKGRLKD
ncbi:hypothetical protein O3P69_012992 [Scylla paramamosain]|uniref:Uncharacterized protein n=1 Tax=Scylla paramamosain TaxID=85552 RepID=A0AAW0TQZ5_SCYPA